jgi:hypothetical protein
MVRFATEQFRAGHLPLDSWFPFLGLGSPQFLHYQSLPAMLAGLVGLVVGPDTAFRWSLYLLLSLWPVSVYIGARLLGAGRPGAGAAAAMSPFIVSRTGIGYEQHAYVWAGFGVWTQLWASMTLPLAWGFSWRAIRHGRDLLPAVVFVALTIALHFETGYLAILPLLLWPLVSGHPIVTGARRAATIGIGALLASAWVIVPLIDQRSWAAANEALRGTALANGYGATRVLGWLASGQLLDHGRIPVITAFAGIGLAVAILHWRSDPAVRALVVALAACLLLSFGRATFGSLVDAIPGSGDIFFRRFMMGAQLAAVLLAGRGAVALRIPVPKRLRTAAAVAALTVILLAPAWLEVRSFDRLNAGHIAAQRRADARQGAEVDQLIGLIESSGGGRTYAGTPSNWGADFTVGAVPVFKYLESADVDEVGYTLRTASLMTGPEDHFDEHDPSDYALFGIRYLILPAASPSPVPAQLVATAGPYALWTTDTGGYVHAGTIVGSLAADRTNLGARTAALLRSRLAESGDYLEIDFGRRGRSESPLPRPSRRAPSGEATGENDDLDQGAVNATVTMRRAGVVVLSSSFDDGWTATVDGRPRPAVMVAPALVATEVPAGTHTIAFRYRGYSGYPALFVLCALTLALFAFRTRLGWCQGARSFRRLWRRTARSWPSRRRTPPGARADP